MFAEGLEGDWIMYLSIRFPGVVKMNKVIWGAWLLCDGVCVVVLSLEQIGRLSNKSMRIM